MTTFRVYVHIFLYITNALPPTLLPMVMHCNVETSDSGKQQQQLLLPVRVPPPPPPPPLPPNSLPPNMAVTHLRYSEVPLHC